MSTYHVLVRTWHGLPVAPTTRLGRWTVILALVSGAGWLVALPALVVDPTADQFVPWGILLLVGCVPGFVCGIAASICAFWAIVRHGERALSVYLGFVPVVCIVLSSVLHSVFVND
jgi:drug/metabolite transporter (DMT)-like permease